MKSSSKEKRVRAPPPRSFDPNIYYPESAEPQGPSTDLDGEHSIDAEYRKSPALERYLHEKDNLALGAAGKPDSGMRRFLDHWQEKWNFNSLSRKDRRLKSLRRDNLNRWISPTHVSKPPKSRPSSWRSKGHIPRKKSNLDLIDADAVNAPNLDNPRQSVSVGVHPSDELLVAARDGCDRMIELLLVKGADIEHTDKVGRTALLKAAFGSHVDVVRVLISNVHKKANIHAKDKLGCNVLHVALLGAIRTNIVSFLLINGADPNTQDDDGKTPLHYCAKYNKGHDAQVLLDAGAATEITDSAGETPLSSAFRLNRLDLVEILLRAGAVIVDSSLIRSSPGVKRIVAKHRERLKRNPARRISRTRTDAGSIEERYRKKVQEKLQSMQTPDGIEPTLVKHDKVVSGVVKTQDQKPGTPIRREYDQEDETMSPEAPSGTALVCGQEPPIDITQVMRSSQENAVEVAKKNPASAGQQHHAFLVDRPSPEDTRRFESWESGYMTSSDDELVQVLDSKSYLPKDDRTRFKNPASAGQQHHAFLVDRPSPEDTRRFESWESGYMTSFPDDEGSNLKARKKIKTGCLNCRRRNIKCDGERPTCSACVRLKLICEVYTPRATSKDLLEGYTSTVGITQSNGAHSSSPIAPDPNSDKEHSKRQMVAKYARSTDVSRSDIQKDQHHLDFSKGENKSVDLLQEPTTKTLGAEAISEAVASKDVKSVMLPDIKDNEEIANPDPLQGPVSESSVTQELKEDLQESLYETMAKAQQDVERSEVSSADSKTENSCALRPTEPTIRPDRVRYGSAGLRQSVHSVARLLGLLAESLGLRERPLEPGLQRVRWTCVCGTPLYDDFREIETGSLAQLQHALNERTPDQSISETISSQAGQHGTTPMDAASSQSLVSHESPLNTDVSSNGNSPAGLRNRRQRHTQSQDEGLNSDETWILPIFQYERYGTKVKHLPVHKDMSDESLFSTIKARYFLQTSRIRRFFALRGVKKISCVKFIYAPREPDIHKFDDWPTQKHSPPWIYKGCPAKKKHIPLVGHTYLMHLWQNPTHTDEKTYRAHNLGVVQKSLKHLRLRFKYIIGVCTFSHATNPVNRITHNRNRHDIELACTNTAQNAENRTPMSHEPHTSSSMPPNASPPTIQQDFRSSYVFLRTPKKLGEQLLPDDENPPEAWGLYFEEGFRIHHSFIVILFFYCLASLAFGVYCSVEYGLVGAHSGAEAFAVSAWMIGLVSLVTTVWFKWAD